MKPEHFLLRHSLFTREEFAEVLREKGRAESTIDAHLARWYREGRIQRVKRGVYIRTNEAGGEGAAPPDYLALASRMAPEAVVAYHTALEAHGFAQSVFERLTFVTATKVKPTTFQGRRFVPVRPPAPLAEVDWGSSWVDTFERRGIEVKVTNLERTVVDVLDRPGLSGGFEEVWRSLESVPAVDPVMLEEYVVKLGRKALAAKVGFFLERRRQELVIPSTLIERFRSMIPRTPVYFDRQRPGALVRQWALVIPEGILQNPEDAWP